MNVIEIVVYFLCWAIVLIIGIMIFKKQKVKPIIWKALIVFIIGRFSFSYHHQIETATLNFAIIPLGVGIIGLFFAKRPKFGVYITYAWFGFFVNYLFLIGTLLIIPLYSIFYNENDIYTYIRNTENIEIVSTHHSVSTPFVDLDKLESQLQEAKQRPVIADWYFENVGEDRAEVEKFPYLLANAKPKWGSKMRATIYVEKDGKGLLIATPNRHYYYRLNESIIQEVAAHGEK